MNHDSLIAALLALQLLQLFALTRALKALGEITRDWRRLFRLNPPQMDALKKAAREEEPPQ